MRAFLAVSVWRLRLAAPFSWLGSLASTKVVGAATRLGTVTGHSVIAGVAAGVGVLGLTAAAPLMSSATTPRPVLSTTVHGESTAPITAGGTGSTTTTTHDGTSKHTAGGTGATTTTTAPKSKSGDTTTTTTAPKSKSGDTTTTTTSPPKSTTTTTSPPKGTTTTTSPPTTTTTTTTTLPVPAPPSGLKATGQCQVLVLDPEVTLSWTASPSSFVTSYSILRKSGSGSYSQVAQVSPSTTSYDDTSVTGLGTSYTYEIKANAPGGTATSGSASATTPTLCL